MYVKLWFLNYSHYLSMSGVMVMASDFGSWEWGSDPAEGKLFFSFFFFFDGMIKLFYYYEGTIIRLSYFLKKGDVPFWPLWTKMISICHLWTDLKNFFWAQSSWPKVYDIGHKCTLGGLWRVDCLPRMIDFVHFIS